MVLLIKVPSDAMADVKASLSFASDGLLPTYRVAVTRRNMCGGVLASSRLLQPVRTPFGGASWRPRFLARLRRPRANWWSIRRRERS
jgi:hypothetical protein